MYTAPEGTASSFRPTEAVVDLAAFRKNVEIVRSQLPDKARLVVVLKADAYGHGAVEIAREAEKLETRMLAVALLEEALDLRRHGVRTPILCLGPVYGDALAVASQYDVTLGVADPVALEETANHARIHGVMRAHLKLDSGMGRMGLVESDLARAAKTIEESPLEINGIYSHYSNASSPDDPLNKLQTDRFASMVATLEKAGVSAPLHHLANSAGIFAGFGDESFWARSGIALYGGNPMDTEGPHLEPLMFWSTRIQRLKWIEKDEVVGYGGSWRAERKTRVATLPVGYADGYSRALSNRGSVLIRSERCPLIGRVSMDLITIDVTDLDEVEHGDEVVLLGRQGDQIITAEEMAELAGTINYEIFTSVSARVPRRWINASPPTESGY